MKARKAPIIFLAIIIEMALVKKSFHCIKTYSSKEPIVENSNAIIKIKNTSLTGQDNATNNLISSGKSYHYS